VSTDHQPPKKLRQLLQWIGGSADLEDILGDLDELFFIEANEKGKRKAQIHYSWQVLRLLFSYALRRRKSHASSQSIHHKNSIPMFRNYVKIAVRNFSKHKLFTTLNLIGLALGMTICLLALSMAVAIYQSDEQHALKDRIFQINTSIATQEDSKNYASTYYAMGDEIKNTYPFVDKVLKMQTSFHPTIQQKGNELELDGYFAGKEFFQFFDFQMISGNPVTALEQPNSMVITQKIAEKLFPDQDPVGQELETNNGILTITGVMQNLKQTHFFFEALTSYSTLEKAQQDQRLANDWVNYRNNYVYVLLNENASASQLDDALEQTATKVASFHEDEEITLSSIRLDKVVPRWNVSNAIGIGWDQPSMLFFLSIGVLILLPAIFNYTNLTIARALKRVKEIGIRKVVGAEKGQIKAQFIIETIILTFLAVVLSVVIYMPVKAEFLSMVRAAEVLDTDMGLAQIMVFVVFTVIVGLITGAFPAQFFSKLSPINTLKGEIKNGRSSVSGFKRGLFVFQFFLSMFFMIGVFTIGRQYSHALTSSENFNAANILAIPLERVDHQIALNELSKHPDVKSITTSSQLPGVTANRQAQVIPNKVDTLDVNEIFVGDDFLKQMNMPLIWGDETAMKNSNQNEELVVVNERFLQAQSVFNVKDDSLRFQMADGTNCRVVGILKDFNYEPLNTNIKPAVFRRSLEESTIALLTIQSGNLQGTLNALQLIWEDIDQNVPFEAHFLDEEIEKAYYFLEVQMKFFSFLSALAITISILGLLGMVSYTTENRTKEIAVRKIMGASNSTLYYLLAKDFVKLILWAVVLVIPLSHLFYDKFFLYFLIRYSTGMGVLEIVLGILSLSLIGFVAIYLQTNKIARMNPANNLRYE
tara:strand:+ start:1546 stop:4167 length:2622 start_codon:yes stop_codon:yes gene_type:complete